MFINNISNNITFIVKSTTLGAYILAISPAIALADNSKNPPIGTHSDQPIYMESDKVAYDGKNALVIAKGNVEIVQGDYILRADRITYFQNKNLVKAHGNITLLEPDGNAVFADRMDLSDDLKKGVIQNFRVRMSNNALFAAREAERINETTIKMKKAVYSQCKLRTRGGDSSKAPLWQLKANKVKIDEKAEQVTYRDAWFEVLGVPVAYSPYFTHPTPNAKRKNGILRPEYKGDSQLGTTIRVPYYWNIAPNKDATITPFLTSKEGLVLEGEYRHKTDTGDFIFSGSAGYPTQRDALGDEIKGREFRGHLFAKGSSDINDKWRWGLDVQRASDDTYLRRYHYGDQDLLTSRLYADRINGRNFTRIQSIAFQGLAIDDDPDKSPFILPSIDVHLESNPLFAGSRARADINSLILTRDAGSETRRLSVDAGWNLPHTTSNGHVLEVDASLRGDIYSISDHTLTTGNKPNKSVSRIIPTLTTSWRYPVVKRINTTSLTLEPQAKIVTSTNGNNPADIPNEDSLTPYLSDANLFSTNRYAGLDRVENGTRAIYGLGGNLQFDQGYGNIGFLAGQQAILYGQDAFPLTNNSNNDVSDYVGRLSVDLGIFDLHYNTRLDSDSLDMRSNDVMANYNGSIINGYLAYSSVDDDPYIGDEKAIMAGGSAILNDNWKFNISGQRDLIDDRTLNAGMGLTFENECITVLTSFRRSFFRDRDIEPNTTFGVTVTLKSLN